MKRNQKEVRFPDLPVRMMNLPVDKRGFPVPWFVAWKDGKPLFPVMDGEKLIRAIRFNLCWVCGGAMGRFKTFVIGPMCVVNEVSSEPPSHEQCAAFAAKHCPFLANPNMKRVPTEKHGVTTENPAGIMLDRNPGVTALANIDGPLRYFRSGEGFLFEVKPIQSVQWWANGRLATREEVRAGIDSGLPILREMAAQDGPKAIAKLSLMEQAAERWKPA